MSRFLTDLDVRQVSPSYADGRGLWRLDNPLVYESDLVGTVTVPEGFETDFASVPRLPVAFWLTGDTAHEAAVVHDYLYATGNLPRELADKVLREAMQAIGVPGWRRWGMYWAVRLFGGSHFGPTYRP